MARDIKVLQRLLPKPVTYHVAKAMGYQPPPMLVTFRDASGAVRREMVPL
jgi:hypothetical protein